MTALLMPGAIDPINTVFILSGRAPPMTKAPELVAPDPGGRVAGAAAGGGADPYGGRMTRCCDIGGGPLAPKGGPAGGM